MKKIFFFPIALMMCVACANEEKSQENQAAQMTQEQIQADKEALAQAIADRDSLFSLINEISDDIAQINELEKILAINGYVGSDASSNRTRIKNDIAALKLTLEQRRKKLAELETKLKESKLTNTELEKTIATLKLQIDGKQAEIDSLTTVLTSAKGQIVKLENDKDSLTRTISTVSAEKAQVEQVANEAISNVNELNKCFYAVGSKKELKKNNILESGFLKKTKIMQGEFDSSFFSSADKRTLKTINLHSKKAKVLTNHPSGTYSIEEVNGMKVLKINNSSSFWSLTNYLVVQID